jgi:hypothetical protein
MTYLRQNLKYCHSQIKLKNTTTYEISKIINSLKNKTSHGYDEISDKILKTSALFILSPLTHIFNKVLSSGIFPDWLKHSEVQPLFKKGEKPEISNYCLISLLPSFSKIIERLSTKDWTATYLKTIYWQMDNSALEKNLLLIWPHMNY